MLKTRPTGSLQPTGSQNLDVAALISAPLIAASNANSMMARQQAKFIMDFCFSKDGDNYYPVMIPLTLIRNIMEPGESKDDPPIIRRINTTFNLPLLTILPINSLAVKTVNIQFEIEITSQTVETVNSTNTKLDGTQKTHINGKISSDPKSAQPNSKKRQSSNQRKSKLTVDINAGQLPLPLGMTTILELYSTAIKPVEMDNGSKK